MSPTLLSNSDDTSWHHLFESIACKLEQSGYVILPAALPEEIGNALLNSLAHSNAEDFYAASIGRGAHQIRNPFVRRDQIMWIDPQMHDATLWLKWTEALKNYLNRRLFLGLFSFESHFACYQPGDFYKKHFDAFRGQSNRILSMVTYLNRGWQPDQGGELVLYDYEQENELGKVQPAFGTLVVFLSEEFPHEVLPSNRERYSVAGWFRLNGTAQDKIDPPA